MQIISKKKLQFNDYEIGIHPRNGEKVAKLMRSFIAGPSLRAIEAPDWIVNDDLFNLAIADGSLIPAGPIPDKKPRQVVEEPNKSIAQPIQPASELSDSDRDLLSKPIAELTGQPPSAHYPTRPDGFPRPDDAR